MIKLLIKHKLFEQAIDAFFNSLGRNFISSNPSGYKIGDRFNSIHYQFKYNDKVGTRFGIYALYDAEIIGIDGDVILILCRSRKTYHERYGDGTQSPMIMTDYSNKPKMYHLFKSNITLTL